jgi:hypothetical protein
MPRAESARFNRWVQPEAESAATGFQLLILSKMARIFAAKKRKKRKRDRNSLCLSRLISFDFPRDLETGKFGFRFSGSG